MKTKVMVLMVFCLAVFSIVYALNPGTETFNGSFDLGDWSTSFSWDDGGTPVPTTETGVFNVDNTTYDFALSNAGNEDKHGGVQRVIGDGDFESTLKVRIDSWGDCMTEIQWRFEDPISGEFMRVLGSKDPTGALFLGGWFSAYPGNGWQFPQTSLGTPDVVEFKVTWDEATQTYVLYHREDETGDFEEFTVGVEKRPNNIGAPSEAGRIMQIFFRTFSYQVGSHTYRLDNWEIPVAATPTPTATPTAAAVWELYE